MRTTQVGFDVESGVSGVVVEELLLAAGYLRSPAT
jgi:hypothetical protein